MAITNIIGGLTSNMVVRIPPTVCYVKSAWGDDWEWVPYLYALNATSTTFPNVSHAELQYEYGYIMREGTPYYEDFYPLSLRGKYVRICVLDDYGETPYWHGIIEEENVVLYANTGGIIHMVAYDLGHLLDRVCIEGSLTEAGWIDRAIPFNKRSHGRGSIRIGNRSESVNGDGIYVQSSNTDLWTNAQVADHVLQSFVEGGPAFYLSGMTDAMDAIIGDYNFYGCSIKEVIDTLIDRKRGIGACIDTSGEGPVYIYVFSTVPQDIAIGDFVVPGNIDYVDCDFTNALNFTPPPVYTFSNAARYDKVVVRGGPLYSTFTLSFDDGSLEKGWTTAEEAAYLAGTGTEADDAKDHDIARKSETMSNVFCRFRVPDDWDWTMLSGETTVNCAPGFREDGTIDDALTPVYWNVGHTLERELPFMEPAGVDGSEPENRRPFGIIQTDINEFQYLDKIKKEEKEYGVHIQLSDREMGFTLRAPFNHLFAVNSWTGAYATENDPLFDYNDIYFTVTVQTDSNLRVEAWVDNPNITDAMRIKVITDNEDTRADWVVQGTVLDVVNGAYVNVPAAYAARNDVARLQAIAAYAAAWYSMPRATVDLQLKGITPMFLPGQMINSVQDSGEYFQLGTVITSRAWDFVTGSTTVQTGYEELRFSDAGAR